MVKTPETFEDEVGETERLIREYRQVISQIIERETAKLREITLQEPNQTITKADEGSTTITTQAQHKAEQIVSQANKEAEKIITEAKCQAEQIVNDAEKRVKKEAKKKTQKEAERIIREAKDEMAKIVAAARQAAEKTAEGIAVESQKEANSLAQKLIEESRKEVEQSSKAAAELKEQAEHEVEEIKRGTREEAERIINDARETAKKDGWEISVEIVAEAKRKAEQIVSEAMQAAEGEAAKQEPKSEVIPAGDTLAEEFKASSAEDVESEIGVAPTDETDKKDYKGRLKLSIVPQVDFRQMATIENLLAKIPDLRLIGRGGSSDGISWAEVELGQPLPILMILKRMLPIKEVVTYRNNIIITLEAGQSAYDHSESSNEKGALIVP